MEIFKTIRRSVSNSTFSSTPGPKYEGSTTWLHPPDTLAHGYVTYTLRLLGHKEVNQKRGSEVVREAITAINFHNQQRRSETSHKEAKLQRVDMRINTSGVTIVDAKTKQLLFEYPLGRISYCTSDKNDKRYLAFIANDGDATKSTCFVLLSDKQSEQIISTIGEAFDLSYKKFMEKNREQLQNQREVLTHRKRIAELEEENQRLSTLLADSMKGQYSGTAPRPPRAPIPAAPSSPPPPATYAVPCPSFPPPSPPAHAPPSSSPPALAPPPPITPRRNASVAASAVPAPPSEPQSVFDDSFDPRQDAAKPREGKRTAAEYESMLADVDKRLQEMNTLNTHLEVGDAGDAFKDIKDIAVESDYSTPRNIVDPKDVAALSQKP